MNPTTHSAKPRRVASTVSTLFLSSVALGHRIVAAHNRVPMPVREAAYCLIVIVLCVAGIVGAA